MNGSHVAINYRVLSQKIKEEIQSQKEDRNITSRPMKVKALVHYVVSHCNIGVTEYLCNASFSSWGDAWLLETGKNTT